MVRLLARQEFDLLLVELWQAKSKRYLGHHPLFVLTGRAGRVSNGRAYLMVTKSFYETCLPEFGIPEMQVDVDKIATDRSHDQ